MAGLKGRGIVCIDIYSLRTIFIIDLQNYVLRSDFFTKFAEVEIAGINFLSDTNIAV